MTEMKETTQIKFRNLKKILKKMEKVAIAFSGGVDSSFLLRVSQVILKDNVIAITSNSPTFPRDELDFTKKLAKKWGFEHIIIKSKEMENQNFVKNPKDRCYFCKQELFSKIKKLAEKKRINYVLDGTNYDDLGDYRPGIKALEELDIISPLKEVQLTKKEIRALSKKMSLETWDKPSLACLSSRFPYGVKITQKKIKKIDKAEQLIKDLGIHQVRVRFHGEVARIEIEKNDFQVILKNSDIVDKIKKLGFTYISLDLEGYRTGSLNEPLSETLP
ncbi:MAG: ATP-dependent sacrificial sulfur transferase LarE [Promethearchaeia archaeon]